MIYTIHNQRTDGQDWACSACNNIVTDTELLNHDAHHAAQGDTEPPIPTETRRRSRAATPTIDANPDPRRLGHHGQ